MQFLKNSMLIMKFLNITCFCFKLRFFKACQISNFKYNLFLSKIFLKQSMFKSKYAFKHAFNKFFARIVRSEIQHFHRTVYKNTNLKLEIKTKRAPKVHGQIPERLCRSLMMFRQASSRYGASHLSVALRLLRSLFG